MQPDDDLEREESISPQQKQQQQEDYQTSMKEIWKQCEDMMETLAKEM